MAEDKKQAAPMNTNMLKKRVLPTRKGKSGAPKPEETSDEEAISDKEASTSEEEDSTYEEEKPATKKQSQPKKPANTLRPNLKTTKEEKKPATAPKKKPAPVVFHTNAPALGLVICFQTCAYFGP
ncbi:hypothetical protein KEM48_002925 [Puccinia striiformis f. sp. tritici PST-130]|nr:hypothetical protein KEM48_002925 [Puccinia striiformis f. sp. tritici PST-130]